MESVSGWGVVVVSGHGIPVGVGVSVGLDALLLWQLDVCAWVWLGMAAWGLGHLAWWDSLRRGGGCGLSCSVGAGGDCERGCRGQGWAGGYKCCSAAHGAERVGGVGSSARVLWKPPALEHAGGEERLCGSACGAAVRGKFSAWGRVWERRGAVGGC